MSVTSSMGARKSGRAPPTPKVPHPPKGELFNVLWALVEAPSTRGESFDVLWVLVGVFGCMLLFSIICLIKCAVVYKKLPLRGQGASIEVGALSEGL